MPMGESHLSLYSTPADGGGEAASAHMPRRNREFGPAISQACEAAGEPHDRPLTQVIFGSQEGSRSWNGRPEREEQLGMKEAK